MAYGNDHRECSAFPFAAPDPNDAVVFLNDLFYYGKTNARSFEGFLGMKPLEHGEDLVPVYFIETDAIVGHRDPAEISFLQRWAIQLLFTGGLHLYPDHRRHSFLRKF